MSVYELKEAERTRLSHDLRVRPMQSALLRAELLGGGAFVLAASALALLGGVARFSLATAAVYVLAIAVASNVRFDVGAGFTVPTQAVFVPMLFALPTAIVPALTMLALAIGMVPKLLQRSLSPSWVVTAANNSWFAIGPSVVLVLAKDHSPGSKTGVLVVALAAQFACDFAAAVPRDRLLGDSSLRDLAREVRPIYATDVALAAVGLVAAMAVSGGHGAWPVLLIAPLFLILRTYSKDRQERLTQVLELNDAYQGTALLLGDVVEADDSYTGEHSKSVVGLALEVADALGLDANRKRNVEFAALLHDIGKLAVPKEIINKPGKLDEREWQVMKRHTIEGQKMLDKVGGFMTEIGRIVRASHERFDGSGYPDGLSGEAISLEARIVSAADAFSAMTSTRSYRKAMTHDRAIAELQDCAGSQFDPMVVDALVNVVRHSGQAEGQGAPSDAGSTMHEDGASATDSAIVRTSGARRPNAERITALAELAVTVGANVQPGQYVEIAGEVGHLDVLRAVVDAAYERGAQLVDVRIIDPVVGRARVVGAADQSLAHVPRWEADRVRELVERGGASILLVGPTLPGLFDELDPRRVALASAGASAQWREANRMINWTIVPAATEGWATRLRPQVPRDEALSALWSDLAHVCRLDEPSPAGAWQERLEQLRRRAAWLTSLELETVHFRGPGTDLTVGLLPGVRWERAEMTTPEGVAFLPNIPTEEVYTTPDPGRVDGQVRLTRPVVIGGREIDDIVLHFRAGRVVEISGAAERAALQEFISRDEGASRLGELALVDADSRVADLQCTFGEILLDENAACHIGLGYGFPELIPPSSRSVCNASDHHLDVMVGSAQTEVSANAKDGSSLVLLRGGRWTAQVREEPPERAEELEHRDRAAIGTASGSAVASLTGPSSS